MKFYSCIIVLNSKNETSHSLGWLRICIVILSWRKKLTFYFIFPRKMYGETMGKIDCLRWRKTISQQRSSSINTQHNQTKFWPNGIFHWIRSLNRDWSSPNVEFSAKETNIKKSSETKGSSINDVRFFMIFRLLALLCPHFFYTWKHCSHTFTEPPSPLEFGRRSWTIPKCRVYLFLFSIQTYKLAEMSRQFMFFSPCQLNPPLKY